MRLRITTVLLASIALAASARHAASQQVYWPHDSAQFLTDSGFSTWRWNGSGNSRWDNKTLSVWADVNNPLISAAASQGYMAVYRYTDRNGQSWEGRRPYKWMGGRGGNLGLFEFGAIVHQPISGGGGGGGPTFPPPGGTTGGGTSPKPPGSEIDVRAKGDVHILYHGPRKNEISKGHTVSATSDAAAGTITIRGLERTMVVPWSPGQRVVQVQPEDMTWKFENGATFTFHNDGAVTVEAQGIRKGSTTFDIVCHYYPET